MTVLVVLGPDGPVLADPGAPLLRADDAGVLRGESVFETLRIVDGRAAFLAAHLARLGVSGSRLALDVPSLEDVVALGLSAWPDPDGVLRLVVTRGGTAYALLTPLPAPVTSVTAVVLTLGVPAAVRAEAAWLLGGVKSTSYAVNMAALREAQARGADDVVFASSDGEVLEGPTSTCAWVTGGVVVTPPAADVGILPGTTLDATLAAYDGPVEVRRGTVEELRAADEVVLLSSVRGVVSVTALDGVAVQAGPVGRALQAAFQAALRP